MCRKDGKFSNSDMLVRDSKIKNMLLFFFVKYEDFPLPFH